MGRSDIEAGRAFVRLSVKRGAFDSGLAAAKKSLLAFAKGAAVVASASVAAGASIAGGIVAAVVKFAAAGDKLDKMSARTGVSVEALHELGFAAEQSGASIGDIENALRRMAKTVGDATSGTKESIDALAGLGLKVEDLAGLTPEKQFETIAGRIGEIQDPTLQAAAAMDVFGRSATQLIPLINSGESGIAALRKEARDLGGTFTSDQAATAARLTDAWNRIKTATAGVTREIGAAFAPLAEKALAIIQKVVVAVRQFIEDNGHLIDVFSNNFKLAGDVMKALLKVGVLQAMETARNLITTVWPAITSFISDQFGIPIEQMGKIWDSFSNGLVSTFVSASKAIVEVWNKATSGIAKGILNTAGSSSTLGKAFKSILGVDVHAERQREKKLNAGLAAKGLATGTFDLGAAVDQQLQSVSDKITSTIESIASGGTAKTPADRQAALNSAKDELAALLEEARSPSGRAGRSGVFGVSGMSGMSGLDAAKEAAKAASGGLIGSFSAAALQAGGSGGSVQSRIAKAAEEALNKDDEMIAIFKERLPLGFRFY